MDLTLGRLVVLVHDLDEAIDFYSGALGFEVLFDASPGERRFVHLAPAGRDGVVGLESAGVWLFEAETAAQRARVGDQTGGAPLAVLYTGDCRASTAALAERGVTIAAEPREGGGSVFAHVRDLYGNELVLVELSRG